MYKFEDIRRLEIEPTNTCQARCPQCLRTPPDGSVNRYLKDELTLDLLQTQIPKEFWAGLTNITFNGSTGDCMAHRDIVEIVSFMKTVSSARIVLHTNGGLGAKETWRSLAKTLDKSDKVIFGIDGLEDTSPLYRIGVDYNLALSNAETFIESGGQAEWQYIVFRHNQHQIDQARELSQQLGFAGFWLRRSGRFGSTGYQDVWSDGVVTHRIEPTNIKIKAFDEGEYKTNVNTTEIDCEAIATKWISIYADGTVWPCCHLMGWHKITNDSPVHQITKKKITDVVDNLDSISLYQHTLEEIVSSDIFQKNYPKSFSSTQPIPVCVSTCRRR